MRSVTLVASYNPAAWPNADEDKARAWAVRLMRLAATAPELISEIRLENQAQCSLVVTDGTVGFELAAWLAESLESLTRNPILLAELAIAKTYNGEGPPPQVPLGTEVDW